MYEHAKYLANLSFRSTDLSDLKILKYNWLRAIKPMHQEQHFPRHDICKRIQQTILTFIIDQKKPIFPILGLFFSKKIGSFTPIVI